MRFANKVAIVTGASSGFGEAIAKRLASEGARLGLGDVDEANGKRVASEIEQRGGEALFVCTDVSRDAEVKALVEATLARFGGLDVLVNNAGFAHRMMPLVQLPESDWDRQFEVNVKSVYLGAKHAVAALAARGGGAIVNTASIGAVAPRPGLTAYNATKGAVVTLTRGLAMELAPQKIRVNAVNPVASDTGFMKGAISDAGLPQALRDALEKSIPLGRLATPDDVAASVCFLASDDAAFLTGVCLPVDGGRSIG